MITPSLEVGAEVLITGDIDHHTGIDAVDEGLLIIDAGHYGLEHIFIKDMARFVSELSDDFNIIREPLENPFVGSFKLVIAFLTEALMLFFL